MSTRTIVLAALVTVLLLVSGDAGRATQRGYGEMGGIFLAPEYGWVVTVTRNGAAMISLTIPRGTILSAFDQNPQPTVRADGEFEFHGNFVLRALPAREKPAGGRLSEVMNQAPVVFTAQDVDAVIRKVP